MSRRLDQSELNSLCRCLADHRRRVVFAYLLDEGSATRDELVDVLVEADADSPAPGRESVAIALDQVHLPMLADGGFVDYEREEGAVRTTDRTDLVEPYLDAVSDLNGGSGYAASG